MNRSHFQDRPSYETRTFFSTWELHSRKGNIGYPDGPSGPTVASNSFSPPCLRLTYFGSGALASFPAPQWAPVEWVGMGSSSHPHFKFHASLGLGYSLCPFSLVPPISPSDHVDCWQALVWARKYCSYCGGTGMALVDVTSIPKSLYSFQPEFSFGILQTAFSRSRIFIPMVRSFRVSKLLPGNSFLRSSRVPSTRHNSARHRDGSQSFRLSRA